MSKNVSQRRNDSRHKLVALIPCLILGLVMVGLQIRDSYDYSRVRDSGAQCVGRVQSKHSRWQQVTVEYTLPEGPRRGVYCMAFQVMPNVHDTAKPGDALTVYYLPQDPETANLGVLSNRWYYGFCGIFCIVLVAMLFVHWLVRWRRGAKNN